MLFFCSRIYVMFLLYALHCKYSSKPTPSVGVYSFHFERKYFVSFEQMSFNEQYDSYSLIVEHTIPTTCQSYHWETNSYLNKKCFWKWEMSFNDCLERETFHDLSVIEKWDLLNESISYFLKNNRLDSNGLDSTQSPRKQKNEVYLWYISSNKKVLCFFNSIFLSM